MKEFFQIYTNGGLRRVTVSGSDAGFYVVAMAKSGQAMCLMAARRRQARSFRSPDPAVALLYSLGVRRIEIDLSGWQPDGKRVYAARRPDVAARMKRAHAAARGARAEA